MRKRWQPNKKTPSRGRRNNGRLMSRGGCSDKRGDFEGRSALLTRSGKWHKTYADTLRADDT